MSAHIELPESAMITQYHLSRIPIEHENAWIWAIEVEWRNEDQWAVTRMSKCADIDGNWSIERLPSNREDEWKAAHRFDLQTALALADRLLDEITINGMTSADVLERMRERGDL